MADVEQKAIAVRKNMERLRALREAQDTGAEPATVVSRKKKGRKGSAK